MLGQKSTTVHKEGIHGLEEMNGGVTSEQYMNTRR